MELKPGTILPTPDQEWDKLKLVLAGEPLMTAITEAIVEAFPDYRPIRAAIEDRARLAAQQALDLFLTSELAAPGARAAYEKMPSA